MLKQIKHQDRALFLQIFTKEILFNIRKQQKIREKKQIEQEKRIEKEIQKPIETKRKLSSIYLPSISSLHPIHPVYPSEAGAEERRFKELKEPIEIKLKPRAMMPSFKPPQIPSQIPKIPSIPNQVLPATPVGTGAEEEAELDLGKLNPFKTDKEITMIECPGPNKFVVIKKAGRVNFTRIPLSQIEIDEIIKNFSAKARIPILGGVFKASVGNLTIAAVISEFVGSRFIINKASPYSILEQQAQQLGQAQFQHSRKIQRQFQKGKFKPRF